MLGAIEGFSVLDLYAGTGALGIEALSRGAARAVFVENAAPALKCLAENLGSLELTGRSVIVRRPVERARGDLQSMTPFDLIFCDPPWRNLDSVCRMLDNLDWAHWLTAQGVLVLEHPAKMHAGLATVELEVLRSRAWGDSAVTMLQRRQELEQP